MNVQMLQEKLVALYDGANYCLNCMPVTKTEGCNGCRDASRAEVFAVATLIREAGFDLEAFSQKWEELYRDEINLDPWRDCFWGFGQCFCCEIKQFVKVATALST